MVAIKTRSVVDCIITTSSAESLDANLPLGKRNELEDSVWYIFNNTNDKYKVINWENYDVPDRWKPVIKRSLINFCGGYSCPETQDIYNSGSSLKTFLGSNSRFFTSFDLLFGKERLLCELSLSDIHNLLMHIASKFPNGLPSASTASDYVKILTRYRKEFENGKNIDGIAISLPKNLRSFIFKDLIEAKGESMAQWIKGGSFQTIPASVAMLLLARGIEINRSPKTRLVKLYFKYLREIGFKPQAFWSLFYSHKVRGELSGFIRSVDWLLRSKFVSSNPEKAALASKFFKEASELYDKGVNFESVKEFSEQLDLIYDYNTSCFIILTGYRLVEVRHICGGDIEFIGENRIEFPTTPRKTKHFPTVREVSSLTAELIKTLIACSPTDKIAENNPIFSKKQREDPDYGDLTATPDNTMRHRLTDCWKDFINNVSLEKEIVDLGITPHALRHTWVDMALRCNVPEKGMNIVTEEIRHHLRHKYGSKWTRRYMDGKFTKEHMKELEGNYFRDITLRLIGEEADDFFGPVAKRIRKVISESNFVDISEANDIEESIQKMSSELVSVKTHAWGLCVLMKDTQTLAKCYDKKSGLADVEIGSNLENCSGCIHRLSHSSNSDYIKRYVLTHQDFLSKYPLQAKKIRKFSENAIVLGEKILKEMS
ncbi:MULTISPECIES: hypothetical protein [Idiomarina]|uniref:hypothetical protein n=1 Tax=Idiomarina TaxID=135575 RepID=UPI000C57EC6F|nr:MULTISPECIES: hypothetical protein [Idiomarina]MBP57993.1 hypothetical protein [Idiomarina sp.]|tara:strand:+ start:6426 stop:8396 length:1971 start_codon:yes stop_codon:yes gene_type:complete